MRSALCSVALFVAIVAPAAFAKTPGVTAAKPADPRAPWMQRALGYTSAIRGDQFHLPYREELILPGRLAAIWWKSDPKRARFWLADAVSRIEFSPNQESDDDRKARLGAARVLLTIAAPLDRGLSDRVLKLLTDESEKQKDRLSSLDRMKLLGDVTTATREIAEEDPGRALEFARQLIKMRAGNHIEIAYINLHDASPATGDQFLREAIAAARADYDPAMLEGISHAALDDIEPQEVPVPEELRSAILTVVAEAMLRPPQSEEDQKNICRASLTAARLISKFPPAVAGQVRAAIESCTGKVPPMIRKTVDSELTGKYTGTSDELMRAADDETDVNTRSMMKVQAAFKLQQSDPIRAVDIFDSLTPEERRRISGSMRSILASQALSAAYKAHDTVAMQRILDHTPEEDRPQMLLNAASMVFQAKDESLGLAFLGQARAALEKWDQQDNWRPFMMLLNLYAEHMPSETTHVLAEAMAGIGRVKPREPKKIGIVYPPMGDELRIVDLNPAVLDTDPEYVAASIQQVDDRASRTVLRLGLLRACLRRFEGPPPPPKSKPAPTPAPARAAGSPAVPPDAASSTTPAKSPIADKAAQAQSPPVQPH